MPGAYTLEWRDARKIDLFGHRGYYYVFSDRTVLSFLPEPSWCFQCGKITLCESLPVEVAIREELAQLDDPNSKQSIALSKSLAPNFREFWKRKLETELRLTSFRKLPDSCLSCGHRSVAHFKEGEWAIHPGTGEEVRFYCSGMCSTDFAQRYFDIQGVELELDELERKKLREEADRERKYF